MATDAQEAEREVDAVVEQLGVRDDVARRLGQRALVAHDAHQVDALHYDLFLNELMIRT